MDIKKIKAIVDLVKESGIAELEIAEGDDKLKITAGGYNSLAPITPQAAMHTQNTAQQEPVLASPKVVASMNNNIREAASAPLEASSGRHITSPMVGTFYRSSSPTSQSFVEAGQEIKVGQVLCIIEAMKLMNQIESDQAGTIKEILVADGAPVEFGQPLFIIA
ncbi:MAG: acetyl-CoA carboxylase biotin carboxyl carrier protein [Burkholderiales bacterium]|nr:acetyl-CoA carboxylase biotin carboxyl carrier protein [Burkholderiales bacterium]